MAGVLNLLQLYRTVSINGMKGILIMKNIEILAPAGSFESLKAAINASCDAVYIGGTKFGARAFADNLNDEDMLRAIDYAHIHDKKIYLTVNTLLKNTEIKEELYDYLAPYYEQGLDAVIIQDVGALLLIHEQFPDLPIHASTQMSLTMAEGAKVLEDAGVTRIVNARELSLSEIKALRDNSNLEIESFIHGALCYCYSGQCLMSSMFGGRSGNRGRCAQPCRMPYELYGNKKSLFSQEEKYLLSPKDICTLDMIPDLIEAGINSFKIEGRMKRPEYAAGITFTYRKYIDKYLELGKEKYLTYLNTHQEEWKQDILNLQDLYNRGGFTKGYYTSRNGKGMMSLNRPNHSGVYVGNIKEIKGNQAVITLIEDINAQDILEIRDNARNLYEFTVKQGEKSGKTYKVNVMKGSNVKPGNAVYRTKNNLLLEELTGSFLDDEIKESISGRLTAIVSEPLKLELQCRNVHIVKEGDVVIAANNQPMTREKLEKQILKTKDTAFEFKDLDINIKGDVFIPVQKLNELRREALEALSHALADSFHRRITKKDAEIKADFARDEQNKIQSKEDITENRGFYKPGIHITAQTFDHVNAALELKEINGIYLDAAIFTFEELQKISPKIKESGKKCYIILPHIFRKGTYQLFLQNKTILADDTISGYIIRNCEEYYFAVKELNAINRGKELITDYNLYTMNEYAVKFWEDKGIKGCTAPVELNYSELKNLNGIFYDMIVYGYLPLMVSAQCIVKTSGQKPEVSGNVKGNPCCGSGIKDLELVDRYQKKFRVTRNCRDCYNTIYNSQCLSLLTNADEINNLNTANIRLNFTFESKEESKRIMQAFIDAFLFEKKQVDVNNDITRGHFKRGVD